MKLLFLVFVFVIITISAKADVNGGSAKFISCIDQRRSCPTAEMNK